MPSSSSAGAAPARLVSLDQLRTLTIGYVLLYHVALIIAHGGTGPGTSDDASWMLSPAVLATGLWRMPMMFLIAGASTEIFLQRRSWREFAWMRARRLLVPAAFALGVVVPVWRFAESGGRETPVAFATHAWDYLTGPNGPDWYHLWFVLYLGAITVAALVARPLAGLVARRLAGRVALGPAALLSAGAAFTVAIQLVPTRIAAPLFFVGIDGRRLAAFAVFFAVGVGFARVNGALARVEARRSTFAVLAIGFGAAAGTLAAGQIAGVALLPAITSGGRSIGLDELATRFVSGAGAWFGALTVLGYGLRYFRTSSPAFDYLRDASYPVYLLHQAVLAWIVRGLAGWTSSPEIEYFVLVALTCIATLVCYDVVVRRTRVGRAVFGLPARVAEQDGLLVGALAAGYATAGALDRAARRLTAPGEAPTRLRNAWRNAASER